MRIDHNFPLLKSSPLNTLSLSEVDYDEDFEDCSDEEESMYQAPPDVKPSSPTKKIVMERTQRPTSAVTPREDIERIKAAMALEQELAKQAAVVIKPVTPPKRQSLVPQTEPQPVGILSKFFY